MNAIALAREKCLKPSISNQKAIAVNTLKSHKKQSSLVAALKKLNPLPRIKIVV
jgi:hypothetical protein